MKPVNEPSLINLLEYSAFGGSLISVWLYGKNPIFGGISGIVTSTVFIIFGYFSGIYAAIFANIFFAFLHTRNLKKGIENDMEMKKTKMQKYVNYLVKEAYTASTKSGWWNDVDLTNAYTVPAKLCLIHSEISEAMEGHRKNLMDDKLPHRKMLEVELADAVIRIADLAGALGLDLGGAISEKMEYNSVRPDHKPENRKASHGKTY